eukprot:scaffold680_cov309-Prasinococcus_capsulatus_cf.AAC.2
MGVGLLAGLDDRREPLLLCVRRFSAAAALVVLSATRALAPCPTAGGVAVGGVRMRHCRQGRRAASMISMGARWIGRQLRRTSPTPSSRTLGAVAAATISATVVAVHAVGSWRMALLLGAAVGGRVLLAVAVVAAVVRPVRRLALLLRARALLHGAIGRGFPDRGAVAAGPLGGASDGGRQLPAQCMCSRLVRCLKLRLRRLLRAALAVRPRRLLGWLLLSYLLLLGSCRSSLGLRLLLLLLLAEGATSGGRGGGDGELGLLQGLLVKEHREGRVAHQCAARLVLLR